MRRDGFFCDSLGRHLLFPDFPKQTQEKKTRLEHSLLCIFWTRQNSWQHGQVWGWEKNSPGTGTGITFPAFFPPVWRASFCKSHFLSYTSARETDGFGSMPGFSSPTISLRPRPALFPRDSLCCLQTTARQAGVSVPLAPSLATLPVSQPWTEPVNKAPGVAYCWRVSTIAGQFLLGHSFPFPSSGENEHLGL